jgi:hypothetical protein
LGFAGKGVLQNQKADDPLTYPQLFERALPLEERPAAVDPTPDAIVINLGTNDFLNRKKRVDHDAFVAAYLNLLSSVRSHFKLTPIFCTVGPMLENRWFYARLDRARAGVRDAVARHRASGDERVYYFEVATQDIKRDGVGAALHPSAPAQAALAAQVAGVLRGALHW